MEVVRALLSAGAKVDLQDKNGVAPLHMACQKGHAEVVCALLFEGATVDLQTTDGHTPLLAACRGGHTKMVCALLSAGARADLHDTHGRTPLDHLPRALRAEVERRVQQAKKEADEGRVGAPSGPVLPSPHCYSASQRRWR